MSISSSGIKFQPVTSSSMFASSCRSSLNGCDPDKKAPKETSKSFDKRVPSATKAVVAIPTGEANDAKNHMIGGSAAATKPIPTTNRKTSGFIFVTLRAKPLMASITGRMKGINSRPSTIAAADRAAVIRSTAAENELICCTHARSVAPAMCTPNSSICVFQPSTSLANCCIAIAPRMLVHSALISVSEPSVVPTSADMAWFTPPNCSIKLSALSAPNDRKADDMSSEGFAILISACLRAVDATAALIPRCVRNAISPYNCSSDMPNAPAAGITLPMPVAKSCIDPTPTATICVIASEVSSANPLDVSP